MKEFDIAKKDARLMHLRLDQWRVEADEFAREEQHKKKKAKTGKNAEEISDLQPVSRIPPPRPHSCRIPAKTRITSDSSAFLQARSSTSKGGVKKHRVLSNVW